MDVPIIDLSAGDAPQHIDEACRTAGFFALAGHGIDQASRLAVIDASRRFFALDAATKATVGLAQGGRAWRGWFPLGDELTSGVPDLKEGYYFGRELPPDDRPLHGPNVWPVDVPELRAAVHAWMHSMEALGQRVLSAMAVGLGLPATWFAEGLTSDPTVLFRVFTYPPHPDDPELAATRWGVAQHTDYGLLTLLAHDGTPGLEVEVDGTWLAAPHDPELIICNLGDMLDRLTAGTYRSTLHRVRNHAGHDRISLPFFMDPAWDAVIQPLPSEWATDAAERARWDAVDLSEFSGTYGDWLLAKVSKVFPALAATALGDDPA